MKIAKCYNCKHFFYTDDTSVCCAAFPKGIPTEIFNEDFDHTKPYPNDNGIMFERSEIDFLDR